VISLKKTIEAYDYRSMWQAALESYLAAIRSLEKNAIGVDHQGVNQYRLKLLELKDRLAGANVTPQSLRELASDLDEELKHYRSDVEALLKESTHDLKDVVAVLAEATESLSQRENLHSGQLARISGSLEAISHLDDLAQVRITLNRQVSELRSCISRMSQDNESALASLQKEITGFQQRLEKVQVEASTDPLTGVANRRRCTREIANRIRSRNPFGILLFDLNKFKNVNDTLGHAAGDAVLQVISQRLSAHVRHDDLVCRWGGDEFVVVHNGSANELAARGKDLANRLSGQVTIKLNGQDHSLSVGSEFGWAEYRAPETPEDLFGRADKVLYGTKALQLKIEVPEPVPAAAPVPKDPATGLQKSDAVEDAIRGIGEDLSQWFMACFAIRSAAKVNNHYGFPATDMLLPFLRDEISHSKIGGNLFRGRGASILALVKSPTGAEPLEEELSRICAVGLEKHLKQKRRASILPIPIGAKLVCLASEKAMTQINAFIDQHRAAEQFLPAMSATR
jgi:diguanylate cyclase (GGDEF)-like protein